MKRGPSRLTRTLGVTAIVALVVASSHDLCAVGDRPNVHRMNSSSSAFTANAGQWHDSVRFRTAFVGTTTWFCSDRVVYQLSNEAAMKDDLNGSTAVSCGRLRELLATEFVGSNPTTVVSGNKKMNYVCNYLIGNDPAQWRRRIANFEEVIYENLYPGIDLRYRRNEDGEIEHDFIVAPGADPSVIAVRYSGAKTLHIDESGALAIEMKCATISEQLPEIYQIVAGVKLSINGEYFLRDERTIGFRLGQEFDPKFALVIDPVLNFSTYLGGSDEDWAEALAVDGDGHAYVTGRCFSNDFPLESPFRDSSMAWYDTTNGGQYDDIFITKLNSTGDGLVYSTYFGGIGSDHSTGIAVDGEGCCYVLGHTTSNDFPTSGAYQETLHGWRDAFVTKLNASGDDLIYSTYLGGSENEYGGDIVLDFKSALIIGSTTSTDFPIQGAYQSTFGGAEDAFVAKLDSTGAALEFSTYLGGSGEDEGSGIDIDFDGNVYVTGGTWSPDFPKHNPFQSLNPGSRSVVFVSKLSANGSILLYSSHLGANGGDYGHDIAVDEHGCAYIAGETGSVTFPVLNPFQSTLEGEASAFVTKFDSTGSGLVYSTFLGGSHIDYAQSIDIDDAGCAFVAGVTASNSFPTESPIQAVRPGAYNCFVTELNATGNDVNFSTYFGGNETDVAFGIVVSDNGAVYLAGMTSSSNFPTENPFQSERQGVSYGDAFIAKLDFSTINVEEVSNGILPSDFELTQNFPNPFNPQTSIEISVPRESGIRLSVFNVLGQEVTTLINDVLHAGKYRVEWNGKDKSGLALPSGVYLCRMTAENFTKSCKLILLK